ncbi:M24 family metallopeptidase [Gemmatimonadota bacterium]
MPRNRILMLLVGLLILPTSPAWTQHYGNEAAILRTGIPKVLPLRDRGEVVNRWLVERLDTILPEIMRREGFDMWIVDNREYNEDPVFFSLMPGNTMAARRRTILVFYDPGPGQPIERLAVSRYGIGEFYRGMWNPEEEPDQYRALAQIIEERDPETIGINMSDTFAFGDGLTATSYESITGALPRRFHDRLKGAERLAVGWLERRSPEEIETYDGICRIAHSLIARAFSSAVIHPGVTRNTDVVWWFRQAIADLDLETWFQPSVDIIRQGGLDRSDPDANIIRQGDVLHCDVGIVYLGRCTDTQQMAYVLRAGENDVPDGLKKALANANRVQDIFMSKFVTGNTGNTILANALAGCREEGLRASIYTHPVGFHGHAAGVTIGMWDQQDGVPGTGDYPLFEDTIYAIELNCSTDVPQWGGESVTIGLEQQGIYTKDGCRFADRRQTAWHIIR